MCLRAPMKSGSLASMSAAAPDFVMSPNAASSSLSLLARAMCIAKPRASIACLNMDLSRRLKAFWIDQHADRCRVRYELQKVYRGVLAPIPTSALLHR